jgi:hypothetical protein
MGTESRHLSVHIARPVAEVYAFVSDPANLPRWASGVGTAVGVTFAPQNPFGVLDHEVRTPEGETVYVPVRAIADGDGCEVVFTLRRAPGMSDADHERDAATVSGDLARLKRVIEER